MEIGSEEASNSEESLRKLRPQRFATAAAFDAEFARRFHVSDQEKQRILQEHDAALPKNVKAAARITT